MRQRLSGNTGASRGGLMPALLFDNGALLRDPSQRIDDVVS